ncbi:MAG TPA: DnaJ domain-containing protein [Xanthomonadaceae bacterium]|jgi:hypothetical protein
MTASPPSSNSSPDAEGADALEQALALRSAPTRARMLRDRPLPGSVLQLIRIAGGEREALASASARSGEAAHGVVEAAVLYIQHVLFHDDADSYRMLGVNPDASGTTIKEHYRWLMHWLHPDRQRERWEGAYAERVNRAWNSLNTDQRRRDYDSRNATVALVHVDTSSAIDTQPALPLAELEPQRLPILSPRVTGWLPTIVFASLLVLAAGVMIASYRERLAEQADARSAATRLDAALAESDSAQKAAIRKRIAFEEHVVSLARTDGEPPGPSSAVRARPEAVANAGDPQTGIAATTGSPAIGSPAATANAPAALSHDFVAAYNRGDLVQLLQLFTPDAVDEHGGIAAISSDYGRLFDGTSSRELDLDGLHWTVAADRIVGSGEFAARIRRRDEASDRQLRGRMEIDAVLVEGRWKIRRIAGGEGE